ncbi:MAG TPA: hypothetical protein PK919_09120 [Candidatus Aminicenantes bacterium]|nr:hypothetical protein [Candidatus Aminicenantes bacterium]
MLGKATTGWQILWVAIWINLSGSVRWMLFARPRFAAHYKGMGLAYPNTPLINILWVVWAVLAAVLVVFLSKKFSVLHTIVLSWLVIFAMTWIVQWNSGVFPLQLLWIAVPWSLAEVFIAALIANKLQGRGAAS